MTSEQISHMISSDSFTADFTDEQRERIKKLWLDGKVREAQQEAQKVLDKPFNKKGKTLL